MSRVEDVSARNIPLPIQREVRQRCGFGCVVCGLPLYEYDHLLGWATVRRHVAEEVTLLCDRHHREKTSGLLGDEAVLAANENPHNLQQGVSTPYDLHYYGDECEVIIGGNRFRQTDQGDGSSLVAIAVDGEVLVGFRLMDKHFLPILRIVDNVLWHSVSPWDIEWVGRRLTVRERPRAFLLEIQFNPPNQAHIQRGRLLRNGVEFRISPNETLINGKAVFSGNDFVGGLGIRVGQPIRGGRGHPEGEPLRANSRGAGAS